MAFLTGYTKRWEYKVAASKVPSTQTSFPVYVDLSDMPATFWSTVADGGGDIRVTRSDGTTECAREVVSCATASDTGELHFLANSVDGTTDTVFYIYANGTSADYAVGATFGRNAVWGDYYSVYHGDEGSGTTLGDSTENERDGSLESDATWTSTGKLGGAISLPKTNDFNHVDLGSGYGSSIGSGDVSFSQWLYVEDQTTRMRSRYVGNEVFTDVLGQVYFDKAQGASFDIGVQFRIGTGAIYRLEVNEIQEQEWFLLHVTRSGSTVKVFIDADEIDSLTNSGVNSDPGGVGLLGHEASVVSDRGFKGSIDEDRLLTSALSQNWITTEYNNQNDHTTWATIGAMEEDGDPPAPVVDRSGYLVWL